MFVVSCPIWGKKPAFDAVPSGGIECRDLRRWQGYFWQDEAGALSAEAEMGQETGDF
jgi:hypothetical protein